ncbi:DUF222 domain-containing protein, partial [Microbacterium timonense]|uniref:DUF222 domain-containing protein n=1 Tax=Microbacterium timonense TaxID=2086576 RepID=UPI00135C610E
MRDRLLPAALELAKTHPVGTFGRTLRRLTDTARTDTLTQRHEEALTRRRSTIEYVDDAMAWLHLHIAAVEARAIEHRITGIATALLTHPDDTRTLDQARADVICDLLIDGQT